MLKSRLMAPALLALLLSGFGLGVVALFNLRFNAGDIYPEYSSFRADPLGAKVLFESLQGLPELSVRRFFQPAAKLQGGRQRVLLILGVDRTRLGAMTGEDFNAIRNFMFSGGRVIATLPPSAPEDSIARPDSRAPAKNEASPPADTPADAGARAVSFFDKNGLRLKNDGLFLAGSPASREEWAGTSPATNGLPDSLSWHSAAYFADLDASWRILYRRRKHAVLVERPFGPGSLVLAADSYFVSNEALRRERYPALLTWLIGGRNVILFDETYLGVEEHLGVAALLRRYHLQGALLGLLLVAGLFVWQNSAPLVPPSPDEPGSGPGALVQGKESAAGFASLLRRSIPPAELLAVCFAEWKTACARAPRAAARLPEIERIVQAQQALPPGSRQPLAAWQTIHRLLTERK